MTEEKTMILPLSFQEITCENCGQTFILLGTDKDGSMVEQVDEAGTLFCPYCGNRTKKQQ